MRIKKLLFFTAFFANFNCLAMVQNPAEKASFVVAEGVILNVQKWSLETGFEHHSFIGQGRIILERQGICGENERVGNLEFTFDRKMHVGYLNNLFVNATFRRCGYGTILVSKVCDELEALGIKVVELRVCATNLPAIMLYKTSSFDFKNTKHKTRFERHYPGFVKMIKKLTTELTSVYCENTHEIH